jgi:signal peptidase II
MKPGSSTSPRDRRLGFLLAIVLPWALLDQATKALVAAKMALGSSLPILGDVVRLTYIRNPQGVFSLHLGSNAAFLFFSLVAILLILFYYLKIIGRSTWNRLAFCLILGGAVGNFIDRLFLGEVRDFLDVNIPDIHIGSYHLDRWPVFNVADSGVTIGVVMLLLGMIIWRKGITERSHSESPGYNDEKNQKTPLFF